MVRDHDFHRHEAQIRQWCGHTEATKEHAQGGDLRFCRVPRTKQHLHNPVIGIGPRQQSAKQRDRGNCQRASQKGISHVSTLGIGE